MRKVMGYALAFTIGTMVSGSVAFASSNYVQALEGQSNVSLNGQSVAQPPKLVFNNTTYVQLYSIEQGLRQAGITPSWDGNTFDMEMLQSTNDTLTKQQFQLNVKSALSTMQTILSGLQLSDNDQERLNTLSNGISQTLNLQYEMESWNVTSPSDIAVKVALGNIVASEENSCGLMYESVKDHINGDTTDAVTLAESANKLGNYNMTVLWTAFTSAMKDDGIS